MSIPLYTDPRFAAIYEALNPPGPDDAFYLDFARSAPRTILDVGCGTGRLACALAERGHSVIGIEPSPAMLDVARTRRGAARVTWVNAGATDFSINNRFDLILMTGHAFQNLLSDDEISTALSVFRRHLSHNGKLAFETRNPLAKQWENWTPEKTTIRVEVAGIGNVEVHHATSSVVGDLVTYETTFRPPTSQVLMATDTLRFIDRDHLAELLANTGFCDFTWYGDWDASPFTPVSPEIIVVASI